MQSLCRRTPQLPQSGPRASSPQKYNNGSQCLLSNQPALNGPFHQNLQNVTRVDGFVLVCWSFLMKTTRTQNKQQISRLCFCPKFQVVMLSKHPTTAGTYGSELVRILLYSPAPNPLGAHNIKYLPPFKR